MEDFTKILGHMQEAQTKIREVQQKLTRLQAIGEAGAGAVKATVNGHKLVTELDINKEYINPNEKEMLQDLIVAAINLASKSVENKIQEEVKQHTANTLGDLSIDLMQ